MTRFHSDLLQPSLAPDAGKPSAAPYSTTTGFLAAFVGGPYAALAIAGLNVQRTGRWKLDGLWLAAGLLLALGWSLLLPQWQGFAALQAGVVEALGRSGWRYAERAFSLALFAAAYARHRSLDRAANLFGLARPNGWVGGLAAIVLGTVVSVVLALLSR